MLVTNARKMKNPKRKENITFKKNEPHFMQLFKQKRTRQKVYDGDKMTNIIHYTIT